MFMVDTMNQLLPLVGVPDPGVIHLPKKLASSSIAICLNDWQGWLDVICVASNLSWFLSGIVAQPTRSKFRIILLPVRLIESLHSNLEVTL